MDLKKQLHLKEKIIENYEYEISRLRERLDIRLKEIVHLQEENEKLRNKIDGIE